MNPDLPALHELAIAAARAGGRVAADGFGGPLDIQRKPDLSEVTQFDMAAERAVIDHIRARRPDDVFLGEEAVDDSYRQAGDRLCWVIDPIDGTRNFTRRSPLFACSVGVLQHGTPLAGAICQPLMDTCWSAWRDGGAYRDGVRLHCDNGPPPAPDRKLVVGIPSARHENAAAWVGQLVEQHVVRNLGSAALHLAMVASGQMDATLMNNCKLWDIAAGALIVTESGGRVSDLAGAPRLPIDLGSYDGDMLPTFAGAPAAFERLLNERVKK